MTRGALAWHGHGRTRSRRRDMRDPRHTCIRVDTRTRGAAAVLCTYYFDNSASAYLSSGRASWKRSMRRAIASR